MKTAKTKSNVNWMSQFIRNQFTLKEANSMKKSRIIALLLVFVLCFSSMVMANNDHGPVIGDEQNPVQVGITKILRMPIGTNIPTSTFIFEARKISFDGDESDNARDNIMPNLTNLTVNISAANNTASQPDGNNIVVVIEETGNIFEGVHFPRAGVYIYVITERHFTNDHIDDDEPYQYLSYSDAVYTLRVYVANTEDGQSTFVWAVGAIITHPDDGDEDTIGFKVDPTPGGGDEHDHSQMIFTNDYVKTNAPIEPDEPDPLKESTLNVSKTVTGDIGDRGLYFTFDFTLNIPILVEDILPYYRAYVVEGTRVIGGDELLNNAQASQIGTDAGGLNFINISSSDITNFRLKHGQRLVFVDTPVGTSYTIEEAATAGYVSQVAITTDSIIVDTIANTLPNLPVFTGLQFVGERLNAADFENERTTIVPTGLNVDSLPFMGMVAFPVIILVGFLMFKARKRKNTIYK